MPSSGNRADLITVSNFSTAELHNALVEHPDGSIAIDSTKLGLSAIPAGAERNLVVRGASYQPAVGGMPLSVGHPSIEVAIELSGAALDELDVSLHLSGAGQLRSLSGREQGKLRFLHDFALPGSTFWLEWAIKEGHSPTPGTQSDS